MRARPTVRSRDEPQPAQHRSGQTALQQRRDEDHHVRCHGHLCRLRVGLVVEVLRGKRERDGAAKSAEAHEGGDCRCDVQRLLTAVGFGPIEHCYAACWFRPISAMADIGSIG